ncbi:MAG: hypothetical protein PHR35_05370 [Kiritimatiellae bacterium]|nr:hypothetical protein [Kiritimatiellia bacterium]
MKRSITAIMALLFAAGMVSAEVTSENIVGYNTVTLKQGYNLLAVNFEKVVAEGDLTMQELFTTVTNGVLVDGYTAGNVGTGDNIQFYDTASSSYDIYYLYKGAKTSDTKNYKWVSAAGVVADSKPVTNGTAFWFKRVAAGEMTTVFAGQVANDVATTKQVLTGYNTFSTIYPVAWNPNDFGTQYWSTNGAVAGNVGSGDNIQFYDTGTSSYEIYYLYKGAKTSDTKNYKWVTAGGAVVGDDIMIPGKGAWYKHGGAGFTFGQDKPF